MPLYHVTGASRETGADRTVQIEAPDRITAGEFAHDQGIFVSTIRQQHPPAPAAPAAPAPPPAPPAASPPPPSNPVAEAAYRPPPPEYAELKTAAYILRVFGWVTVSIGGIVILVTLISAARSELRNNTEPVGYVVIVATMCIPGIATMIAGLLQAGLGSALFALRDIARNSFR